MADETGETDLTLRKVTFKLAPVDMARLRRIAARRYPEDRHKMNQTLRELIREEDARGERIEKGSGK